MSILSLIVGFQKSQPFILRHSTFVNNFVNMEDLSRFGIPPLLPHKVVEVFVRMVNDIFDTASEVSNKFKLSMTLPLTTEC